METDLLIMEHESPIISTLEDPGEDPRIFEEEAQKDDLPTLIMQNWPRLSRWERTHILLMIIYYSGCNKIQNWLLGGSKD